VELIQEDQQFPFIFTCVLAALVVLSSVIITHIIYTAPLHSNLFYWYMSRAAGFTSYEMLSISVILGVSSSSGLWDKLKIRKLVTQMHQYSALLVFPFLFFHLWGLHQDTTVRYQWINLLVPFSQTYRPVVTTLGVLVLYGWIILIVTSYLRERITVKMWRAIHYAAFPMFLLVTLHGLLTGTDGSTQWARVMYIVPTVLFVILVLKRMRNRRAGNIN